MDLLPKLTALLGGDDVEAQLAAAVVLRELRVRNARVVAALTDALASPVAALVRTALTALVAVGSTKPVPRIVPLLRASDQSVRRAAADALVALGDAVVPPLRAAAADAAPEARRAIDEVLARVGGKDALAALLAELPAVDLDGARAAIAPLRQRLRDAAPAERKRSLAQAMRVLGDAKLIAAAPARALAAAKIVGFIADPQAAPALLALASRKGVPDGVAQEALVALRLTHAAGKPDRKLAARLMALADAASPTVAHTALLALGGLPLARPLEQKLAVLAARAEDVETARLAIGLLGQASSAGAADALGGVLLRTGERARAEAAAEALSRHPEGPAALVRALLAASDGDRAAMLAGLLRPRAKELPPRQIGSLRDELVRRLERGEPGWEPLRDVARVANADATVDAMRTVRDRLRPGKRPERALAVARAIGGTTEARPEDGWTLAVLEWLHGLKDESLIVLSQLAARGFDVAAAAKRDRALGPEQRYQIGFRLVERGVDAGADLLAHVVDVGGRTKLAQMARAKLKSSGLLDAAG